VNQFHPVSHLKRFSRTAQGFTLIEILIVVTILALLLSLTANISQGVVDSMNFRQAIQNLKGKMESARQTAITTNRTILVRLVKGKDELGNEIWNGVQIGHAEIITDPADDNYAPPVAGNFTPKFIPADPVERLPLGLAFHDSPEFSSLLSDLEGITHGTTTNEGGLTESYASFVFQPDGRCALTINEAWTLTVIKQEDLQASELPPDYVTLQLDPRTARTRIYRR